jgi:hypothetical protein
MQITKIKEKLIKKKLRRSSKGKGKRINSINIMISLSEINLRAISELSLVSKRSRMLKKLKKLSMIMMNTHAH